MTDHQPEGAELAAQLGDAVGGPEVPDPETPLSDAEHTLGEARILAQSWVMEDGIRREDGLSLLAVLGDAALPVGAVDPETITEADLAEALDNFWLFVACGGQRVHGQVADPGEVASVLLSTVGRIAAERSPDEPARPVAAALDPKHLQAALEALSAAIAGAEYEHQKKRYKAAWAALDALEGKGGSEGERHPGGDYDIWGADFGVIGGKA